MNRFRALCLILAFGLGVGPALAQEIRADALTIAKPWARATPKGAEVGAAYLEISNAGPTPDTLTGGSADFAKVEIHEMSMQAGVMTMRELKDGLVIPAHGTVKLAPSGYHLMLADLKSQLVKGATVKITLTFKHAGSVAIDFPVEAIGAAGPADEMKGMDMKGM
jgi:hypothetical protein